MVHQLCVSINGTTTHLDESLGNVFIITQYRLIIREREGRWKLRSVMKEGVGRDSDEVKVL